MSSVLEWEDNDSQLSLPILGSQPGQGPLLSIPRGDRVFVNRNLKLANIDWFGFDMDYTLAIYNQPAMDTLSVELTLDQLVRRGYPTELRKVDYDIRFPIRGLLIDKRHGHALKMDRFKAIHKGYHGMKRLSQRELSELYWDKRIRPKTARYHWIDTLFSLSEVTTYVAVIHALERRNVRLNYAKLFQDVRDSIDEAHRVGDVYRAVTSDLPRYIDRDRDLAHTLHKLRSAGKRLFMLTNSPLSYTENVMSYLLDGAMPEYKSWRHYFDAVVVSAQKPSWFQQGSPFLEIDGEVRRPVKGPLERGKLYQGGNLRDFERMMNLRGSNVLYVGDHIYGDILRSKKESSWRTAMIIQELDAELVAHEKCVAAISRLRDLEGVREHHEDRLRFYQARLKDHGRNKNGSNVYSAEAQRLKRNVEGVRGEIRALDTEHRKLHDQVDDVFHPYWGSMLKEGGEMSSFGVQVETYADIYMRRVSSLRHYSARQFFRSAHDLMPHEL